MIWFTSDDHFSHTNIITYCKRPFSNIDHMNEILIKRWNERVKNDDTIYVVGDFILSNNRENVLDITHRLHGNIILIPGDHDASSYGVSHINIAKPIMELRFSNVPPITLCHWCMRVFPKSHYNAWHLFGHSHGQLPSEGKTHDVGVDNNNFRPISLDEIVELMKYKPDNFNLVKKEDRKEQTYQQLAMDLTIS